MQKRSLPPKPKKVVEDVPAPKPKRKDAKEIDDSSIDESISLASKGVRVKPSIEGHVAKYDELFSIIDKEIERKAKEMEKGCKQMRKMKKILVSMRKELGQITRSKAARKYASTRKNVNSGLNSKYDISDEFRKFLKLKDDQVQLSRIEANRAVCAYINLREGEDREDTLRWAYLNPKGKRNLQDKKNKMAVIPDEALSKLLKYEKYKKDVKAGKITKKSKDKETGKIEKVVVDDDALYYWTIQVLLTPHLIKPVTEVTEE